MLKQYLSQSFNKFSHSDSLCVRVSLISRSLILRLCPISHLTCGFDKLALEGGQLSICAWKFLNFGLQIFRQFLVFNLQMHFKLFFVPFHIKKGLFELITCSLGFEIDRMNWSEFVLKSSILSLSSNQFGSRLNAVSGKNRKNLICEIGCFWVFFDGFFHFLESRPNFTHSVFLFHSTLGLLYIAGFQRFNFLMAIFSQSHRNLIRKRIRYFHSFEEFFEIISLLPFGLFHNVCDFSQENINLFLNQNQVSIFNSHAFYLFAQFANFVLLLVSTSLKLISFFLSALQKCL